MLQFFVRFMALKSNKKNIKEFIVTINFLNRYFKNSQLWKFTRSGLGDISQGDLFDLLNNSKQYKLIDFLKIILSVLFFFIVIITFPIKFISYHLCKLFKNKKLLDSISKNKKNRVFIAPTDLQCRLKGSHKLIFENLQKKYEHVVLIPLNSINFKNFLNYDRTSPEFKSFVNPLNIYFENPIVFAIWIKEIIYIIFMIFNLKNEKFNYPKKLYFVLSFLESSLRQSFQINALIYLIRLKLNNYKMHFYTTFEANTFEKVLVFNRSRFSFYETFNTCAITKMQTKHNFYLDLITKKGFPNIINTSKNSYFNSSLLYFYKNNCENSILLNKSKFKKKSLIKKGFKYKFTLLCEGRVYSDFLFKFIEQILDSRICDKNQILVALHPSVPLTRYALSKIKKFNLLTTFNLTNAINESQIGIFLTSSSALNALSTNMPLIKIKTNGIEDYANPLEFIQLKKGKIYYQHFNLKKKDRILIRKLLLITKNQIRKTQDSWFYG